MAKRMILMLVGVAVFVGAVATVKFRQIQMGAAQAASFQPPPEAVTTIVAGRESWPEGLSAIGTAVAIQGVTVSADLPGIVSRIAFESGARVEKGAVLVELDARQEQAQLTAAVAQLELARLNLDRTIGLRAQGIISLAENDRVVAEHKQAEARVGEIRATLDRKTIKAPFSGVLGIRQINLGQYLQAGDPVVPLQAINPIYVNFTVTQQDVPKLRVGGELQVAIEGVEGPGITGRITAVDSIVDSTTRNVQVQATLPEPGGPPAPGHVREDRISSLGTPTEVVALPASAINYAPYGDSVFVVADLKGPKGEAYSGVRQQFVKLGGARGDQVAVLSGVEPGETVVTSGAFKLRNGSAVRVNNTILPAQQPGAQARGQLMRFTDLFIKRPVLAIVVNLVILIAGLQSIRSLSVRQYPRSDIAVIRVSTIYVGANADLVRGFITTPLERVIASADGIDYLESSSAQSMSTITVHLKLNFDTSAALTQIQAKVAQVRNDLPPESQAPVIELETADQQSAAMYIGFSSEELDQNQITDYLTRVVQPKLSAISGVQRADILGSRTFAMRVWLKPEKMAALGLSPTDVRNALARNNYLSALGQTKGSMVSVNLVANTDLKTPEEFRQLVVKEKGGSVVRLGEVADVVLGAENYEQEVRFDGQAATFMGIWVLPTANSLDVLAQVRAAMPEIKAQLPAGVKAGIPYDSTLYIQDAIDEVLKTLSETLLIVVIVIFLFLGSVRSVLIPVVAIPISLVGAVFLMLMAGFTINLLTLLAVVLAVGLVVDDAIVMVENVERHIHEGKRPAGGRDPGRARAGGAHRGHDHHPGRGLRARGHPGRLERGALPRVRVHPGRRRHHLRHRRPHPVADDELAAPSGRRHRARLRRHDQPPLRGGSERLHPVALGHAALPPGGPHLVGHRRAAGRPLLHVLAAGARAHRRPGGRVRDRPGLGQLDPRSDEALRLGDRQGLPVLPRDRATPSRSPSPPGGSAAW